jgi:AGZA family xanthine/uracil permease-like MFS transporter
MNDFFKLEENKTTVKTEIIAGITTFITMAYIIFVNPSILAQAGMNSKGLFFGEVAKANLGVANDPIIGAVFVATVLSAIIGTLVMGLVANVPFAQAAGMGMNAFFTFYVVGANHYTWQAALAAVFVCGLINIFITVTKIRIAIVNAIPESLKNAIGAGIGLFIAFIGLKEAGFVVANKDTLVSVGDFTQYTTIIAAAGLIITAFLMSRKIKGSILIGIILTTVVYIGYMCYLGKWGAIRPEHWVNFKLNLDTVGKADLAGALKYSMIATIFAFLITDFFDTMGTVIAVGTEAGHVDKEGRLPRLKSVLFVDSIAAAIGGFFGCSSVTTYVESASGVAEGGRTGLTAVVVGILFLLALPFAPIVGLVPAIATAPALIIVGFLMMSVVKDIPFDKFDEGFPAFLGLITMPLTYSITKGIGFGFISYTLVKVLSGKYKEVHPLMYIVTILFIINFVVK